MMNKSKITWLILSSFGIMFAVLSWLQDSSIIPDVDGLGGHKGLYALITGLLLYLFFRKSI